MIYKLTTRLALVLAWYDCWVGFFYDQKKSLLYFFPLPMVGLRIDLYRRVWLKFHKGDQPRVSPFGTDAQRIGGPGGPRISICILRSSDDSCWEGVCTSESAKGDALTVKTICRYHHPECIMDTTRRWAAQQDLELRERTFPL